MFQCNEMFSSYTVTLTSLTSFIANKFNFYKMKPELVDSLNTDYDYKSIMHYGSTAFGIKV